MYKTIEAFANVAITCSGYFKPNLWMEIDMQNYAWESYLHISTDCFNIWVNVLIWSFAHLLWTMEFLKSMKVVHGNFKLIQWKLNITRYIEFTLLQQCFLQSRVKGQLSFGKLGPNRCLFVLGKFWYRISLYQASTVAFLCQKQAHPKL